MRVVQSFTVLLIACLLMPGATARILTKDEAGRADAAALAAEAYLFKSIGMGIALSLAHCEGQDACTPPVSEDELQQLIDALNERINSLVERQEGGEDLADVLTAYVNQRENYLRYKEQLGGLSEEIAPEEGPSPEVVEEAEVFVEEPKEAVVEEQPAEEVIDFSIFEDVDEEVQ
jgi:hypothetical protein